MEELKRASQTGSMSQVNLYLVLQLSAFSTPCMRKAVPQLVSERADGIHSQGVG